MSPLKRSASCCLQEDSSCKINELSSHSQGKVSDEEINDHPEGEVDDETRAF